MVDPLSLVGETSAYVASQSTHVAIDDAGASCSGSLQPFLLNH